MRIIVLLVLSLNLLPYLPTLTRVYFHIYCLHVRLTSNNLSSRYMLSKHVKHVIRIIALIVLSPNLLPSNFTKGLLCAPSYANMSEGYSRPTSNNLRLSSRLWCQSMLIYHCTETIVVVMPLRPSTPLVLIFIHVSSCLHFLLIYYIYIYVFIMR